MLRVDGEVEAPVELSFADLESMPKSVQVIDVSRFNAKRPGDGITLNGLLDHVKPKDAATYLTLHASADDFAASIPLQAVRDEGIVVYRLNRQPLPLDKGGPVRFLIPNPAACHTDELDDCANVKFVDRIELTAGKGRDTRPDDDEEHEELHRHEAESNQS